MAVGRGEVPGAVIADRRRSRANEDAVPQNPRALLTGPDVSLS